MKPAHQNPAFGAACVDLELRVDRIGDDGLELDEVLSLAWLDETLGKDSPFRAVGDGRLRLFVQCVDRVVHARGRLTASFEGACVRCLERAEVAIDAPLALAIFPVGEEPDATEDGEIPQEDVGVAVYHDEIIKLADIVRDEVFLELPMNPLCDEACAGLCPACGVNRNTTRCQCSPEVDIRWLGLRSIKVN